MAFFRCKMCGGELEIVANATVAECMYCGGIQTLPKLNDDKIERLYDRANHFRRNNEFDKAIGIYEEILNENPEDAESYWSLVLCKYGIEYVEDPATKQRIPTVNRAQYTAIYDDDNYKSALKYADVSQKLVYQQEAKQINEIQKGILEISQKEEPFDVFICYKETDDRGQRTRDSVYANELYHELTQEGFKVFFSRITLEDKLGEAYEPYIFAALNSARVMVVLGSRPEFFEAVWVKNEWSRYLALIKAGQKKTLIPAYKDMDPYDLPAEFAHLQAQDMNKLGFMPDLIRGVKKLVGKANPEPVEGHAAAPVVAAAASKQADVGPLIKRIHIFMDNEDWSSADIYCEKVLDLDPENVEAYRCKLLVDLEVSDEVKIVDVADEELDEYVSYKNLIRYADDDMAQRFLGYNRTIKARLEKEAQHQAELARMRNAVANASNYVSALVAEKERTEQQIEYLRNQAANYVSPNAMKKKANWVLIWAAITIFFLIVGAASDADELAPVFLVAAIVYIVCFVKLLRTEGRSLGWLAVFFVTYGIYGVIHAFTVRGNCKRGKYDVNKGEIEQALLKIRTLDGEVEQARSVLMNLNNQLRNKENEA